MKKRNLIIFALVGVLCLVLGAVFKIRGRQFQILDQAFFSEAKEKGSVELRGWGIYKETQLDDFLKKRALSEPEIAARLNWKSFKDGFLFVTENGHLEEILFGAEGIAYAKIQPTNSSGFEISIIEGPRKRPIKVF